MRDQILSEIHRLAAQSGGRPPGSRAFATETGIRETEWRGVYWARWGDALVAAGLAPNKWQERLDSQTVLELLAVACRHYDHMPTRAELQMYRRSYPGSPSRKTVTSHFGSKGEATDHLREWATTRPAYSDVATILGPRATPAVTATMAKRGSQLADGFVYLIRSGPHHKIGRSEELERRVKEIRVALPEAATLEHAIRTDDPAGIEAYWHRRFADRRANGEWFKLTSVDVAAFKRRKYQ